MSGADRLVSGIAGPDSVQAAAPASKPPTVWSMACLTLAEESEPLACLHAIGCRALSLTRFRRQMWSCPRRNRSWLLKPSCRWLLPT